MCCSGCHSCGVMESSTVPFRLRVVIVFSDIIRDIWLSMNTFGPYVWNI
jgi:hypothetical protein